MIYYFTSQITEKYSAATDRQDQTVYKEKENFNPADLLLELFIKMLPMTMILAVGGKKWLS